MGIAALHPSYGAGTAAGDDRGEAEADFVGWVERSETHYSARTHWDEKLAQSLGTGAEFMPSNHGRMSASGTLETYQPAQKLSAYRGRPAVTRAWLERRD